MVCELFKIGDITGFICGAKPDHECDSDGSGYLFNDEGEYFEDSDCPPYREDPEACLKWMKKYKITGGCCSCSICHKPFSPPMF